MSGTSNAREGRLGKYELRGTLGRGAMGTVYDGWDPAIDRRVAIKTVRLADADDEETAEALARFKREAQAAGRLSHPNIVGVYDYGETDQIAFIVMEFVEGRSLKSVIDQERRLPPPEAAEIMTQVLAGLAYSHARGVVHRDIKPANIMITATEGQVKIADFGIARIESSSMTSVGTVMGTPAYMPPEQFLGEQVDARSDIYASGVMLFHLLTGERPYEGSMTSIMHKVLNAEAPPLASSRAGVSPAFDRVIATAMARAPAERFPSAGAFSTALAVALAAPAPEPEEDATMMARPAPIATGATRGRTEQPVPAEPARALPAPARRGPSPVLLGVGVLALLLAAGGAFWVMRPGTPPVSSPQVPIPQSSAPSTTATASQPAFVDPVVTRLSGPLVRPSAPLIVPPADPQAVRAALATSACTALRVNGRDNAGAVAVSGLAGSGESEQGARRSAEGAAGAAGVSWSVLTVPPAYCLALDVVRIAATAQSDASRGLGLTLNDASDRATLRDREPITPRMTLPGFAAWLSVDYLSNDGSQAHLLPSAKKPARLLKPDAIVKLSGHESLGVGPPFGRDMLVAVASAEPLFSGARPEGETMAQYLGDLRSAVQSARDRGVAISAAALVVDTTAQ